MAPTLFARSCLFAASDRDTAPGRKGAREKKVMKRKQTRLCSDRKANQNNEKKIGCNSRWTQMRFESLSPSLLRYRELIKAVECPSVRG